MAAAKPTNALVVRTFAYPFTVPGTGPDDPGTQPLGGVTVRLTRPRWRPAPPPQVTDPDGKARFENIPADNYQIVPMAVADLPPGYQPPPADQVFLNGRQQTFANNILVRDGGEVVVDICIAPVHGRVNGTISVLGVANAAGIRVEARSGSRLVDFAQTDAAGFYDIADIDQPGLIEIRPAPEFMDPATGRAYAPKHGGTSQFVVVPPGRTVTVDLTYEARPGEIEVGAQVVVDVNGKQELQPFEDVTFQLFEAGNAQPLRELTTRRNAETVFADLREGAYRVVAVPPPARNGQRLQLIQPPTPEVSLRLADGQRIDLSTAFQFAPTRGSVLGLVVVARDNTPLPGVAIVLYSQQDPQVVRHAVTDADGQFEIDDLLAGNYRVELEQQVVTALGRRWEQELQPGQTEGRTVEVRPRATAIVPEFRLVEEEHLVTGQVVGPDGQGAAFVIVEVFRDTDTTAPPFGTVLTDSTGAYRYRAPTAGTYFFRVREENGFPLQLTPVAVNRPTAAPTLRTSRASQGVGSQGIGPSTPPPPQDLNDFPFLTEEIDVGGGPGRPARGAWSTGQIVEGQLRDVLGVRPRVSDPAGFLAAMQQAFTVKEVEGHTEVTWNPRSYSVQIQADLGAITGAQASLYSRAKGTLEQVVPLLDGLEPLRVDVDTENVAAIRSIVRSQLTELVGELGVEGGPRVQRVDQLFVFLLGVPPTDPLGRPGRPDRRTQRDADRVEGTLGVLRDRLGLDRDRINTIEEEQGFTNFLVVLDHVVGLADSWDAQRVFFDRGATVEPFLGTQLVLLSRDLEVIAESVHEVEFAMNSVFLGEAERQTLELRFPVDPTRPLVSESPPMFVSELLGWVERFATEEGRRLIEEGGRQGVVAFRPTIELLQALVTAAQVPPKGQQDPNRMPAAYGRRRVQRALEELAQQLGDAAARVALIREPVEDDAQAGPAVAPPVRQLATRRTPPRRRPPTPPSNGQQPAQPVIT